MTRQLGLIILLSVWAILIVLGASAYVGVRQILVSDLDALLLARAAHLPELAPPQGFDPSSVPLYDWRDEYTIHAARSGGDTALGDGTRLLKARFETGPDGQRRRCISVAGERVDASTGRRVPVVVEYHGSTARVDALLRRVAQCLMLFGLIAGVVSAGAAVISSRWVLRPLRSTARLLETIDAHKLDARMALGPLPAELVPVADQLNEMLSRLERAFAGQKQFVASASHELRTPVAALMTTLDIASRQPREAESYRQTIGHCRSQVQVLQVLIERLMEYIGADSSNSERAQPTDVCAMVKQCADIATALGHSRGIAVTRSGPTALRCLVPPNRLRSILVNLLSNGVEHHDGGGVVEIGFFHDGSALHVRISDDGPGIAPEHAVHVFTPFYRVNRSSAAAGGGGAGGDTGGCSAGGGAAQVGGRLGLGLFIVQSHVNALRGSCRMDSRLGEGTTFDIELPCIALQSDSLLAADGARHVA
jgi:signal transduction histidine kinase